MAKKRRKSSKSRRKEEEEGEEEETYEDEAVESSGNSLKELTELVEKFSRPSAPTATFIEDSADVAIDSIGLSYSEFKELIARVNGFTGSFDVLLASMPPKLRQATLALYRYAVVFYDPSIGAWRVNFLRLRQKVKVLRAPVEILRYYLPSQAVSTAQSIAPATQLQLEDNEDVKNT
jgi:hypothetical protein